MTDYNDGNWHGWNGGEMPVDGGSVVEIVSLSYRTPELTSGEAFEFDWDSEPFPIVAFRVIKEYREPREWWLVGDGIMRAAPCEVF